jgi:hypothetical protein
MNDVFGYIKEHYEQVIWELGEEWWLKLKKFNILQTTRGGGE